MRNTTKTSLWIFSVQAETVMGTFAIQVTCWANALRSRQIHYVCVSYSFNEKHKLRYGPG